MNKDVIYIEPEDDITDIITKIEKSKEKIVALVPPKKAGVFRSVVNIKLIAKSGTTAEKTVVLVTTDPSIVKLAAATKLPVTKNLQSAPVIPKAEEVVVESSKEELVEESDGTVETKEDVEKLEESEAEKEEAKEEEAEEDDAEEKPEKKKKGEAKSNNKFINWIKEHKKLAICGGIGIVLVIVILIWALVIAPAVTVTVGVRTTSNNFSENVTFTENLNDEKASEGKFYLEEKKVESTQEIKFDATGKKNVGEKAKGDVVVYTYFKEKGTVQVSAGSNFTYGGLSYVSNEATTLSWDGTTVSDCENVNEASAFTSGCLIYGRVGVTAAEPGSNYNIAPSNSGWNTTANVGVYSDKAMSGGTDQTITVVQQSDIDKAKAELASGNETENKNKILEQLSDDVLVIDSSFKQTTGDAVSTPAVGEEVKEGEQATLKATTTASMYVVDKTKVEEFITEKANLSDDQKIYEIKNPFIENFTKTDSGYVGKLKTSYLTGPKITVASIVDAIKGRGIGDAQHVLKDIDGVASVTIDTSYPWVTAVPNDTNKITVNLEIKDQDGNEVKQNTDEKTDDSSEKKTENKE